MSARDEILSAVRSHLVEAVALPDLAGPWIEYPDPVAQFSSVLEMIGGQCVRVASRAEIPARLQRLTTWQTAKQTVSTVSGVTGNLDLETIADPHDLEQVDFAVLTGRLAVAENAAVWVSGADLKHRVLYFLCQHLALVVPTARLVHNMAQAYEQLPIGEREFGAFIAGPSKTADIEQSLVIGAHGPRSMTVFLVDADA